MEQKSFELPRTIVKDERTGRTLWKLTPDGANYVADYMYKINFTPDEKYIYVQSDRDGLWQFYRLHLDSGMAVQLTDFDDAVDASQYASRSGNINPERYEFFYVRGSTIQAVHMESLERRQVVDLASDSAFKSFSGSGHFSQDGRYMAIAFKHQDGRMGIYRIDCESGEAHCVFIRPEHGMQHLQYVHDGGHDLMSFSAAPDYQQEWDQDDHTRARTYLLDLTTGKYRPLIVTPPPCTATHEFWGPTGDRIYYHKKTRPTWVPTWLCCRDRHTMEEREIFRSDEFKLGHSFVDRSETFLISDAQNANDNPLLKVDIATGAHEILCWPDSSVKDGQLGHVHPSISPSGRYVLYTTDKSGHCQVYIVPL